MRQDMQKVFLGTLPIRPKRQRDIKALYNTVADKDHCGRVLAECEGEVVYGVGTVEHCSRSKCFLC